MTFPLAHDITGTNHFRSTNKLIAVLIEPKLHIATPSPLARVIFTMSSHSPSSFVCCAAVLFLASASGVTAAVDNPAFKTRLGIPCTTIAAGGLDCRQFGLLGMTDREVQELVNNCPCACKDSQCNATEENMIKIKPLSVDMIKETATPGYTIQQQKEAESADQTENEVLPENIESSTTPDSPVPTKTNAPTASPTAAPTSSPTRAPTAKTTKSPSLRSNPSLIEDEEGSVEQEVVAVVKEDAQEEEEEEVDLLKKEATKEEQPATSTTTATTTTTVTTSVFSPKQEANNDMMPVTPNDNGTYFVPPENSGRVSKTTVKFIVSVSMLLAAFIAFHLYRKCANSLSSDGGKGDDSEGTMSRDETMSDCEVTTAAISATPGTADDGVEVLDP